MANSHGHEILQTLTQQMKIFSTGIPVECPKAIVQRTDRRKNIHEEALHAHRAIINNHEPEVGEAWLTVPATPHISSTIDAQTFTKAGQEIIGNDFQIPEKMKNVQKFPAQIVLWWTLKNKVNTFIQTASLPEDERNSVFSTLHDLCLKAYQILQKAKPSPNIHIWGAWGFANEEERLERGSSRGLPSVESPHIHIMDFDPASETPHLTPINELEPKAVLKHLAPWEKLIFNKFKGAYKSVLSKFFNAPVEIIETAEELPNQARPVKNGFKVILGENGLPLPQAFELVFQFVGQMDEAYQKIFSLYAYFYKTNLPPGGQVRVKSQMSFLLEDIGFNQRDASEIIDFILQIRPTYRQLEKWQPNGELARRYSKLRPRLFSSSHQTPFREMIKDTLSPAGSLATETLTHRFTGAYDIPKFEIRDEQIIVQEIDFYFGASSTKTISERELGAILARETNAGKN